MTIRTPIDATRQIESVTRLVGESLADGPRGRVTVVALDLVCPVDALWRAVTSAEALEKWFAPITGSLVLGGRYRIEGNAHGTVLRCRPFQEARLTWEFGSARSDLTLRTSAAAFGRGSRIELEHVSEVDEGFWRDYGPGATGVGWDLALLGLAVHLAPKAAGPDALPSPGGPIIAGGVGREEMADWAESPAGIAFISTCSDRWASASIASGAPVEQARAAARATTEFYTSVE